MKHLILIFVSMIAVIFQSQALETIVIQPDSITGKDATVHSFTPSSNFGNNPILQASSWEVGNKVALMRFYLDFPVGLPENAVLESVKLSLKEAHADSPTYGHFYQFGSNSCYVKRVLEEWDDQLITWESQPKVGEGDVVEIPRSSVYNQDYEDIDVTSLFLTANSQVIKSFSLAVMMEVETGYKTMMFASSEHPDSTKRPKLTIQYYLPISDTTIVLQPDSAEGKDAYVHSYYPQANISRDSLLQVVSWSISGWMANLRTYIDFKIPHFGNDYIVASAKLSLYGEQSKVTPTKGHYHEDGSNAFYIKHVTSKWEEKTINWNNQPSFTDVNQVLVPMDTSSTQDYLDIDVTRLIRDIMSDTLTGYGLMLTLQEEMPFRTVLLASSDHKNPAKRPKLVIKMAKVTSNDKVMAPVKCSIFPNPASQMITINIDYETSSHYDVVLYDLQGRPMIGKREINGRSVDINVAALSEGYYLLVLRKDGKRVTTEKLLVRK